MKWTTGSRVVGNVKISRPKGAFVTSLATILPLRYTKTRKALKTQPVIPPHRRDFFVPFSTTMLLGSDLGANSYSYLSES